MVKGKSESSSPSWIENDRKKKKKQVKVTTFSSFFQSSFRCGSLKIVETSNMPWTGGLLYIALVICCSWLLIATACFASTQRTLQKLNQDAKVKKLKEAKSDYRLRWLCDGTIKHVEHHQTILPPYSLIINEHWNRFDYSFEEVQFFKTCVITIPLSCVPQF